MKLPKQSGANKSGFTIFELLIVMGLVAVISVIGVPVGLNFYLSYQLDAETSLFTSVLRQARNLAMINQNESDHGVYLDDEKFILFQGSSFVSRTVAQDRVFPRSSLVTVSGPGEIIFSALSGQTASSTYFLSDVNKTANVYVNAEGLVY